MKWRDARSEKREARGEKVARPAEGIRWFGVVVFAACVAWPMAAFGVTSAESDSAAGETSQETPTVLELHNGDFVRGKLLGVADKSVSWQSPFMVDPLKFKLNRVAGIVTKPQQGKFERGAFAVELSNGRDQLFGDLQSIDDKFVTLESPQLGILKVKRSHIRRLWRVDRVGESFSVPTRLRDWKLSKSSHWETRRGVITSEVAGATLFADVGMPRQVQIEFELLYDPKESAFAIAFGTIAQEASWETAFSIETWGRETVAQRRNKKVGDVFPLEVLKSGTAHYVVYLDRDSGQMLVYNKQGQKLGDIRVPDEVAGKPAINASGDGITIINRKGTLRLKQLRMSGWSGTTPRSGGDATVTVALDGATLEANELRVADGIVSVGEEDEDEVAKDDPTENVASESDASRENDDLDEADSTKTVASNEEESDEEESDEAESESPAGTFTEYKLDELVAINFRSDAKTTGSTIFLCKDGARLTGTCESATESALSVRLASSDELISIPVNALRSVHFAKPSIGAPKQLPPYGHRNGTLELMDTRLTGWLVEAAESDGQATDKADEANRIGSCLVWQASESETESQLLNDLYGRIVYVQPKQKKTSKPQRNANVIGNAINLAIFNNGRINRNATKKTAYSSVKLAGAAIHLRSGDTIPCSVTAIDEKGVQIKSKLTETKHIPHKLIKAAQLKDTVAMPVLGEKKRERFLTLPRMQRDIPPQHLLFSKKGDILRGSIVSMSDQELNLELRLDSYRLPRSRVSAIVWLHQDELLEASQGDENSSTGDSTNESDAENTNADDESVVNPAKNEIAESADNEPQASMQGNVQVVGNGGGSRFTFFANSFSNQAIIGHSEVLQEVHAKVADIDQLLLGKFIQRAARSLPYHQWRLTSARDPKFVTAGDESSGEAAPGTESSLVGQAAPDISLPSLDGEDFELSNHKGHCVVLDFWATWCGPCLKVMPQVEEVVAEFAEQEVRLFAVNLEETAEQIRATLERRKLNVNVVLDRDGVAAARYEATAIPQTVVIAPDGTVTRVFVGSSRDFKEQLRTAIKEVTAAE